MHGPFILALWLVGGPIAAGRRNARRAVHPASHPRPTPPPSRSSPPESGNICCCDRKRRADLPPDRLFDDPRRNAGRPRRPEAGDPPGQARCASRRPRHRRCSLGVPAHHRRDGGRSARRSEGHRPRAARRTTAGRDDNRLSTAAYDRRLGAWMWPALLQCPPAAAGRAPVPNRGRRPRAHRRARQPRHRHHRRRDGRR